MTDRLTFDANQWHHIRMAQYTELPADHGLTCPWCSAPVERHVDIVEVPHITGLGMKIVRKQTRQAFLACVGCEWCETIENLLANAPVVSAAQK